MYFCKMPTLRACLSVLQMLKSDFVSYMQAYAFMYYFKLWKIRLRLVSAAYASIFLWVLHMQAYSCECCICKHILVSAAYASILVHTFMYFCGGFQACTCISAFSRKEKRMYALYFCNACMYIRIYACIYLGMYVDMYLYVWIRGRMHIRTHSRQCWCDDAHIEYVHVTAKVCARINVDVMMHVLCLWAPKYAHASRLQPEGHAWTYPEIKKYRLNLIFLVLQKAIL